MSVCSVCETPLAEEAAGCARCGAPPGGGAPGGTRMECRVCGEVLWSKAETCVHCGAKGYPALRPKLGDKSEGAPADWKPRS